MKIEYNGQSFHVESVEFYADRETPVSIETERIDIFYRGCKIDRDAITLIYVDPQLPVTQAE